ncbi:MAG: hypothetical protein MUF87_13475 [Anaerolineae bacterium]|jgi:hypothetical protein|nr:hypothetical protein [Anaerolineae bacterium]
MSQDREAITRQAAEIFQQIAHFLTKLIFRLFAEDVELLLHFQRDHRSNPH